MPRPKLIAGNWKMYTTRASAAKLAADVLSGWKPQPNVTIALCPPFPYLTTVVEAVSGRLPVGAQNCHYENEGAYTGEVSPTMLRDCGCEYVIIGHSERRHGLNESDQLLAQKLRAAIHAGLRVIFCIGELLSERENLLTEQVLHRQITAAFQGLDPQHMAQVVIAYEPVWAIGTGKVATPDQAQTAHAFVRNTLGQLFTPAIAEATLIQYGGSVKPDNARSLLELPDVDGALVGGASLKADSFLAIAHAALP